MNWLFEGSPLVVIAVGGIALAALLAGIAQTGKRVFLYLMPVVVLMIGLVLAVQWLVITPGEEVQQTLQTIADELERNDRQAVISHVSPTRPDLISEARSRLGLIKFEDVSVRNVEVDTDMDRDPPQAVANFKATVRGGEAHGAIEHVTQVKVFRVIFRREEDGQWRVTEYEMSDPR